VFGVAPDPSFKGEARRYENVTPRLDALGDARPFVSKARGLYMAEANAEKEGHSDVVAIGAVCKGAQSEGLAFHERHNHHERRCQP